VKLRHTRSRAGRRGGKHFQNGPLIYVNGRPYGRGTYTSRNYGSHHDLRPTMRTSQR